MAIAGKTTMKNKGKGSKVGAKRHVRSARAQKARVIANPAYRRIARRAGVSRVASNCYDVFDDALKTFLTKVLERAHLYKTCAGKKTLTVTNVAQALKALGKNIIGY